MVTRLDIVSRYRTTRQAVLAVLCIARSSWPCSTRTSLIVALPQIGRELRMAGDSLQWAITGYVVVYAGLLLAAGGSPTRSAQAVFLSRTRALYRGIARAAPWRRRPPD